MDLYQQYPQVQSFINYLKFEKRYSQHTIISYQTDLEQFTIYLISQFDAVPINKINASMVRSWLAELKGEEKIAALEIRISSRTVSGSIHGSRSVVFVGIRKLFSRNSDHQIVTPVSVT